jgi:hypothetical protein
MASAYQRSRASGKPDATPISDTMQQSEGQARDQRTSFEYGSQKRNHSGDVVSREPFARRCVRLPAERPFRRLSSLEKIR